MLEAYLIIIPVLIAIPIIGSFLTLGIIGPAAKITYLDVKTKKGWISMLATGLFWGVIYFFSGFRDTFIKWSPGSSLFINVGVLWAVLYCASYMFWVRFMDW